MTKDLKEQHIINYENSGGKKRKFKKKKVSKENNKIGKQDK